MRVTLLALIIMWTSPLVAIEVSRDDVRSQVRSVFERGEYQSELPTAAEAGAEPGASLFDQLLRILGADNVRDVIWLCLIAGAAITVALLAVWLIKQWGPVRRTTAAPTSDPSLEVSERPLGDADALASQGEFGEAIHVLLLRTIEEIRAQLQYDPPDSLTSREILAKAPLSPDARRHLSDLVGRVEKHYFGETVSTREDYDRCVEVFRSARESITNRDRA